jgi:hypothetical protein
MKIIRLLSSLLTLQLMWCSAQSQGFNEGQLQSEFETYLAHFDQSKLEDHMGMMVSEFVEYHGKNSLLEQLSNNPCSADTKEKAVDIKITNRRIKKVYDSFYYEGSMYVFLDHQYDAEYQFYEMNDLSWIYCYDIMLSTLMAKYANEEVVDSRAEKKINLSSKETVKTILAIRKEGDKSWKFMDYDPDEGFLYSFVFSDEIAELLESNYADSRK